MASAKVSLVFPTDGPTETTEMIIVGGGICGILAAKKCHDLNIPYKLIEREDKLGGNWHILANAHSYLQVFSSNMTSHFPHSTAVFLTTKSKRITGF